jgi:ABC-2 type transport system ATP-binding protein
MEADWCLSVWIIDQNWWAGMAQSIEVRRVFKSGGKRKTRQRRRQIMDDHTKDTLQARGPEDTQPVRRAERQDAEVQGAAETQRSASSQNRDLIAWARGLTKTFGEQVAVRDLNFEVPRGSVFGFIGPSGCGKTTTIRLLTGIYKPTSGEVQVLGRSPAAFTRRYREKIGYLTQGFVLYPDLSVMENLSFAASLYGVPWRRSRRINQLLEFVELDAHKNKLARDLSGGMQRRLMLASTMLHSPELLFLDEPTGGIDPVLRRKIWDYFEVLQSQGLTLFVTTQYVGEAAYCDYVGIMSQGRLLLVDTPEGLRRRAYGGDIINLRTNNPIESRMRASLDALPFMLQPSNQVSAREVRLVVDEANTAIPPLMDWVRSHNMEIESIGEFLPPFDDVFVKLVKEEEQQANA